LLGYRVSRTPLYYLEEMCGSPLNCVLISHVADRYSAIGVPSVEVSILELETDKVLGTLDLCTSTIGLREHPFQATLTVKNQMRIPSSANSVTYTPPPAAAKPAPYEFASGATVVQPDPELAATLQSVSVVLPV
jgi:hypothetical protein